MPNPDPLITRIHLPSTAITFSPPQTFAMIKKAALSTVLARGEWSLPPRSMLPTDRANSLANSSGITWGTSTLGADGFPPFSIESVDMIIPRGDEEHHLSIPLAGQQAVVTSYLRVNTDEIDALNSRHWDDTHQRESLTPYLTLKRVALDSELEDRGFDPNLDRHIDIASKYAKLPSSDARLSEIAPSDSTWRLTRSLERDRSRRLVPTFVLTLDGWSLAKGQMALQKRTDEGLMSDTEVGATVEALADIKIVLEPDVGMANALSEVMTPCPPFARAPEAHLDDRQTEGDSEIQDSPAE